MIFAGLTVVIALAGLSVVNIPILTKFVLRRPVAVLLTAVVGLGVVALPATSMELGLPDDGSKPTEWPRSTPPPSTRRATPPHSP